ncbi:MAG: MFS transporter [Gemmatimonadales bacterium]|nr:MAG: MFS transporter [Gemmatimonadales bacterium]
MTAQDAPRRKKIPFLQKAAFGSGHLVNNLLPGALGVFQFFLLTAFGINPFLAGLLGGLPRLFDAITDPIMGYVSDNTQSKYGRRRPYIFMGAILAGLMFIMLWQMNPEAGQLFNFWYFLLMSLLFIGANTIFSTPLIALGYEMTSDYKERTRLMGFAQTVGQFAWMIVPWFWVIIANPNLFDDQAEGVRTMAWVVGAACIVLGILPGLFCREIGQENITNQANLTLKDAVGNLKDLLRKMGEVFKNRPFVRLCGATFLVFNGFQMVASFSYFIILFYLFNGDYELTGNWPAWFSTVSAFMTAFVVIPIITWMANKVGKRNAFIYSTAISVVGYILKWWGFNPDNPWLMFMPIPLMAFGIGGLFVLMMSMTADVCDLDELENGMPRKEGTFGAIYWWMVKLGQGLALVMSGAVLALVGFDQNAATQTAETMTNLRIADIVIPALTASIAIWVMWGYDLTEEKTEEIQRELVARRGEI